MDLIGSKRKRPISDERGESLRRSTRIRRRDFEVSRLMELCNYCKLIRVGQLSSDQSLYQRTLKEVSRSANNGCTLCCFLSRCIANFSDIAQKYPDIVWSLSVSQREKTYGPESRPTQVKLMRNRQETPFRYDICKLPEGPHKAMEPDSSSLLRVYNERHPQDHDVDLGYFPRLIERDPLSDATIELVRDWLTACTSHEFCRAQVARPLPKRLISVHSSAKVMLTEHDGELGHYLALSHCWGSVDDAFSTTEYNFAERTTTGIDEVKLPNNFQHAIAFTRRLKYDYIWIDSLCIIQHDQDDWACEASKMAQYYNNASLTLTAADALTCHVGFLHFRNHYTSPPISANGEGYYCLRAVLPDDYELNLRSPISKRAWTLQERLISPRTIHFTRDQLLWHCRTCEWTEGYVHNSFRSHDEFKLGCQKAGNYIDREEHDTYWRSRLPDPNDQPYFNLNFAVEIWYSCISEYTTRFLSHSSDKLAAISGLAQKYANMEMGRYLAGLWEQDIFRGLAWTRVKPGERTEEKYMSYFAIKAKRTIAARALKPPVLYRAPSWSWASVNGPVAINEAFFYFLKLGASAGMKYEVEHWESEYGPRLVTCALKHSRASPYLDTLEGSFIQVEGYCRPLWVSKTKLSSDTIGPNGPFVKNLLFDDDQSTELFCYLNQPRDVDPVPEQLLVFQICKQCTGLRLVYGLLLEEMPDTDNAYRRAGVVELACYNLCSVVEAPIPGFVYFQHPTQRRFGGIPEADYKTKEWQKERWEKRTIKLF